MALNSAGPVIFDVGRFNIMHSFLKILRGLFSSHEYDGICYVPKTWLDNQRNCPARRLLYLIEKTNQWPIDVIKIPKPKMYKDYCRDGIMKKIVNNDSFPFNKLANNIVRFEIGSGLPLLDQFIPQIIAWLEIDFKNRYELMPSDNILIRIVKQPPNKIIAQQGDAPEPASGALPA